MSFAVFNPVTVATQRRRVLPTPPVEVALPSTDPNLWGWWSSDTDLQNNGAVLTGNWTDRGGSGRNWVRYVFEPPLYSTSGPNGKPMIVFQRNGGLSGLSSVMTITGTTNAQPYSLFMLLRLTDWGHNRYLIDRGGGAQGAIILNHVTPSLVQFAGAFSVQVFGQELSQWFVLSAIYDGASSLVQINNNVEITTSPGSSAGDGFTLNNYGGGGINGANWNLAGLILTTAHASNDMRTVHKNWLANYGGITLGDEQTAVGPASVNANIAGWWKADASTSLSDGNAIETWLDSSNRGKYAYMSTIFDTGRQPLYKTGIVNGKPVFRLDATNDGLNTQISHTSAHTTFIVYSCRGSSGFRRALQGTNNWLIGPYNGSHRFYSDASGFIIGPAVVTDAFVYVTVRQQSGETKFRVNGVEQGSSATNGYPGTIGLGTAGTFSEPLDGDIAEVITYSAALSNTDMQTVEAYLAAKYAI